MRDDDNVHRAEEVAVIGMTGRFPGARDIDQYWQNLKDGVESITFFSDKELVVGVVPVVLPASSHVRAGGVLDDIDLFDSSFFGFNSNEADLMDPQQRIFLQSSWAALESAGYNADSYEGRIGVYAGATISTYLLNNVITNPVVMKSLGQARSIMGNDSNFLATRVSYKLNLNGPSMVVQTACSSSLVAVHLACQSLLNGESDMALAGGISISIPQSSGAAYREGGIHSPDGHCRTFDAQASGTVGGSGIGIVVLKRLDEAIADGDYIHAIIKGSAVNNDGYLKIGFAAPSVGGQAAVIGEAFAMAGVNPESITYIEAHGTGTLIGDSIEAAALTQAFRTGTEGKNFCAIGSVKTNIGHLDAASGVVGLIKIILALKHKLIPASLHFESLNPKIDFANSPFYVNTKLAKWISNGRVRRAGISSLGIGGTNVHMILEEAPEIFAFDPSILPQLLLLSARTKGARETATANLIEAIRHDPGINLADVSFTLQAGRKSFAFRRAVVCQGLDDAATSLEENDSERVMTQFYEGSEQPIAFMFSGQGLQYRDLIRQLREEIAGFREPVDECAALAYEQLGIDLLPILATAEAANELITAQIGTSSIKELLLFSTEYALARMWMDCGVRPQAIIGYNTGEYVAACLAGVFTLAEGVRLVAARGQLLKEVPFAKMTDQSVKPFMKYLEGVSLKGPSLPYVSSVTGKWITAQQAVDPHYWERLLRHVSVLGDGLEELMKDPRRILFEVDPGETLCDLAKLKALPTGQQSMISTLRVDGDFRCSKDSFLDTLARLWITGIKINSDGLYLNERRQRIPLPTYPFEKRHHWVESPVEKEDAISAAAKDKSV